MSAPALFSFIRQCFVRHLEQYLFLLQDEKNEMLHTNLWLNYVIQISSSEFALAVAHVDRELLIDLDRIRLSLVTSERVKLGRVVVVCTEFGES